MDDVQLSANATNTTLYGDRIITLNTVHPSADAKYSSAAFFFYSPAEPVIYDFTKAKFYLSKVGSPTGNLTARLYTTKLDASNQFTLDALSASSAAVDSSTLTVSPTYGWATFQFSKTELTPNSLYGVVLEASTAVFDATNKVLVGYNDDAAATAYRSLYSSSAWAFGAADAEPLHEFLGEPRRPDTSYILDYQNNPVTYTVLSRVHPTTNTSWSSAVGQSFRITNYPLFRPASAKFYLLKTGTPTGTLQAEIYAATGTHGTDALPTATALDSSSTINIEDLSATEYTAETFTLPSVGTALSDDTTYTLILKVASGTVDDSNYVRVGIDNVSLTHAGNGCYYRNGWLVTLGSERCFSLTTCLPYAKCYGKAKFDIGTYDETRFNVSTAHFEAVLQQLEKAKPPSFQQILNRLKNTG